MLAITIFEDTTQIVVGKKIKNKLEIKSLISYKSIYEAYINKDVKVLFEEEKEGMYKGHTENYILVYYKSEENLENKMKKVICKEVEKNYIIAK